MLGSFDHQIVNLYLFADLKHVRPFSVAVPPIFATHPRYCEFGKYCCHLKSKTYLLNLAYPIHLLVNDLKLYRDLTLPNAFVLIRTKFGFPGEFGIVEVFFSI